MTSQGICGAQSETHRFYIQIILKFLISWLESLKRKPPYLVSNLFRRAIIDYFAYKLSREFCILKIGFASCLKRKNNFDHSFLRAVFYSVTEELEQNTVVDFVVSANPIF